MDAAIAAEFVLGLVEPQSSGIGGGGFLMFYDGRSEAITAYDGRERAPAGATPTMFLDNRGRPLQFMDAQASGRSIGAPSLVAMLKMAHEEHGRLPWSRLVEPAMQLAEDGFEVSPRLARSDCGLRRARTFARGFRGARVFLRRCRRAASSGLSAAQSRLRAHAARHRRARVKRTQLRVRLPTPSSAQRKPIHDAAHSRLMICAPSRRGGRSQCAPPIASIARAPSARHHRATPRLRSSASISARGQRPAARRMLMIGPPSSGPAASPTPTATTIWPTRNSRRCRRLELIAPQYLDQRAQQIDVAHAPAQVLPGMPVGPRALRSLGQRI